MRVLGTDNDHTFGPVRAGAEFGDCIREIVVVVQVGIEQGETADQPFTDDGNTGVASPRQPQKSGIVRVPTKASADPQY
ncbi:hypothetical protein GCM10009602_06260 [Nocardiopsis tropica]